MRMLADSPKKDSKIRLESRGSKHLEKLVNMKKITTKLPIFSLMGILLLLVQSISLFRTYPSSPACGRVMSLFGGLNVLINCDSAVFMKDAQDPSRVFEGVSVYQDRPAHSTLAWVIGSFLKWLGFPNQTREVIGNSGQLTNYESIFYLSYLLINLSILLAAVLLAVNYVFGTMSMEKLSRTKLLLLIVILTVTANELTKTFFWTPHSQMLNVLLPVLGLTLLNHRTRVVRFRQLFLWSALISVLMFFYPLFGILFGILLFVPYGNHLKRLLTILSFSFVYVLYPSILEILGGRYHNPNVDNYRQYVWLLDSARDNQLVQNLRLNLGSFATTFSIIPTIIILGFAITYFIIRRNSPSQQEEKLSLGVLPYLLFFSLYITALSLMGYYSRRLTLGPYIFLELLLIKLSIQVLGEKFNKSKRFFMIMLLALLAGSWIWTNGPLE